MPRRSTPAGRWSSPATTWARSTPTTSAGDSYTLAEVLERDPERFVLQPEGHALDREQPHVVLVPANPRYSLRTMTRVLAGHRRRAPLDPAARRPQLPQPERLPGPRSPSSPTTGRRGASSARCPIATSCHKPATVSGGGKSEISKAITDAFIFGSEFVADFDRDMDSVAAILDRDYSKRFLDPPAERPARRSCPRIARSGR